MLELLAYLCLSPNNAILKDNSLRRHSVVICLQNIEKPATNRRVSFAPKMDGLRDVKPNVCWIHSSQETQKQTTSDRSLFLVILLRSLRAFKFHYQFVNRSISVEYHKYVQIS